MHDLQLRDEGEQQLHRGLVANLTPLFLEDALDGDLLAVQCPPVNLSEAAAPQDPIRVKVIASQLQRQS